MILMTGPTGNSGRELLRLFEGSDHDVVCMSRRQSAREELEAQGWTTVHGDFDDRDSLDQALSGAERAYLVCTPDRKMQEREIRFIDAAADAELDRLVVLAGFPCPQADSPVLDAHAAIESHLRQTDLDFTVIRPLGFMQSIYWMSLPTIRSDGMIVGSAGEGRNAVVDLRDVALVAHQALTGGTEHEQAVYDLTGPEALTLSEMAETLGRHLNRDIRYVDLPPEHFAAGLKQAGLSDYDLRHPLAIFQEIREHRLDMTIDTLSRLGIEARSWSDFSTDVAAGRTGAATSFDPPASN